VEAQSQRCRPIKLRRHAHRFLRPILSPIAKVGEAQLPPLCRRVRFQTLFSRPTRLPLPAPMEAVARLRFRRRPAKSRGHDRCRRPASREVEEQLPSRPLPVSQLAQLRFPHHRLLPVIPAVEERSSASCSKTTNSASQTSHRRFRSALLVAEALRRCLLRSRKLLVHFLLPLPFPAWKVVAAQRRRRVRRLHLLCPSAQAMAAEAQRHRLRSALVLRRPAILAPPVMAVAQPLAHSPFPSFQGLARFPATRAAGQSHSAIPARAACGRFRCRGHRPAVRRFPPAVIPPIPWCVRSRREEALLRR
jgi:hypothetical protein